MYAAKQCNGFIGLINEAVLICVMLCRVEEEGTGQKVLEGLTWIGSISLALGGQLEPRCQASHMVVAAHSLPHSTLSRIFTTQLNIFLRVCYLHLTSSHLLLGMCVCYSIIFLLCIIPPQRIIFLGYIDSYEERITIWWMVEDDNSGDHSYNREQESE